MKNNAIVTMCFGSEFDNLAEITHPLLRDYADRLDTDFVIIKEKKFSTKHIHYEKFQLYDLLLKYQRTLFLDTDLIIRPDCPDLFDIVPEHKIGLTNTGRFWNPLAIVSDACKKHKMAIHWKGDFFNTGVMVLSNSHRDIFGALPTEEHDSYAGHMQFEQPYLNLKFLSGNHPIHDLGYRFNRLSMMDRLVGEHRLSSYIVHYASAGIAPDLRLKLIKTDLKSWKETAPTYNYS